MYTKDDYFKYSNGTVILFFLKSEEDKFIEAFQTGNIKKLCDAACLEQDKHSLFENSLFEKSRWLHVKDEFDLIAQCKRMKSNDKYIALSKSEIEHQGKD